MLEAAQRRAFLKREETERRRQAYLERVEEDRERAVAQITYLYDQRQLALGELSRLQATIETTVEEMARSPLGVPSVGARGPRSRAARPSSRKTTGAGDPLVDTGPMPTVSATTPTISPSPSATPAPDPSPSPNPAADQPVLEGRGWSVPGFPTEGPSDRGALGQAPLPSLPPRTPAVRITTPPAGDVPPREAGGDEQPWRVPQAHADEGGSAGEAERETQGPGPEDTAVHHRVEAPTRGRGKQPPAHRRGVFDFEDE
jgi:hypothetical protein